MSNLRVLLMIGVVENGVRVARRVRQVRIEKVKPEEKRLTLFGTEPFDRSERQRPGVESGGELGPLAMIRVANIQAEGGDLEKSMATSMLL